MGNPIAGKRGGSGGRNAPPTVYAPFGSLDDDDQEDEPGKTVHVLSTAFVWLLLWVVVALVMRLARIGKGG